jgi:DNA repair exonuclease SbcCD ATPase subunit
VSTVVYARVPDTLKQALEARARERGLSQTATVVELLEQGLQASDDQRSEALGRELASSTGQLERTRARLTQAEARLEAAQQREEALSRSLRALAERARHELASCPQCRKPLRGLDLLVTGHCPNCNRAITTLLTPRLQTGAPDKDEYLALMGALGGLLGLALATSNDPTT